MSSFSVGTCGISKARRSYGLRVRKTKVALENSQLYEVFPIGTEKDAAS